MGQALLQLCRVLHLRSVAVIRDHGAAAFERTAAWLRGLGATQVLRDTCDIKVGYRAEWNTFE